jgi:hypothetical protein
MSWEMAQENFDDQAALFEPNSNVQGDGSILIHFCCIF